MPSYKLHYFKATGRAETARMIFALKGVKFEDIRYSSEEWQKVKADMPMKQLPVLEVDGERYGQSAAINSFLARELGAYGKGNKQALMLDELVGCVEDIGKVLLKLYMEKDPQNKEKLLEELKTQSLPEWMEKFKPILARYVKAYPNDKEVTLGEITLYNILEYIKGVTKGEPAMDTLLQDFANKVEKNPNLKKYIANRPT